MAQAMEAVVRFLAEQARLVRRLVGFRFPWRLGVLPLPSLIREEAAEARADGVQW